MLCLGERDLRRVGGDNQRRVGLPAPISDHGPVVADAGGINVGHWFVEHEHGGSAGERPHDGQSISLAVRQLFRRFLGMIFEIEIGQPVEGRPRCTILHLCEMSAGRAVGPQTVILRHPKQRQAAIVAIDEGFNASTIGTGEAAEQIEQRRLAGSGDAQDGRDAAGDVEIRNVQPRAGPALDANVFQMPQSIAHGRRRTPEFPAAFAYLLVLRRMR